MRAARWRRRLSTAVRTRRPSVDGRRLAFIHLPRAGGTAVQHHLEAVLGCANVARVGLPFDFLEQLDVLRSSPVVVGHFFYPVARLIPDVALTTVLRDPVERSISVWEHPHWHPDHPDRRALAERDIRSIDDFIEDPHFGAQVRNNQTRFLGNEYDLERIVAELEVGSINHGEARHQAAEAGFAPADEAMLERAKRRLERMLVVGVTEELTTFLRLLDGHLSASPSSGVERINASPRELVARRTDAYDDATRERLADLNSLDAELYAFGRKLWERQRDAAVDADRSVRVHADTPAFEAS